MGPARWGWLWRPAHRGLQASPAQTLQVRQPQPTDVFFLFTLSCTEMHTRTRSYYKQLPNNKQNTKQRIPNQASMVAKNLRAAHGTLVQPLVWEVCTPQLLKPPLDSVLHNCREPPR